MTPKEIIAKVGTIESYVLDPDIELYYKHISKLPPGSRVVDIGTGWGKSAAAMALCNPNVEVWTFDPGNYPMDRGYGKDVKEYTLKIIDVFNNLGIENIKFSAVDATEIKFPVAIDVLHFDLEDMPYKKKKPIYDAWVNRVKVGGVALVRNYDFKDRSDGKIANELMKDWKQLKHGGLIRPFKRV